MRIGSAGMGAYSPEQLENMVDKNVTMVTKMHMWSCFRIMAGDLLESSARKLDKVSLENFNEVKK